MKATIKVILSLTLKCDHCNDTSQIDIPFHIEDGDHYDEIMGVVLQTFNAVNAGN